MAYTALGGGVVQAAALARYVCILVFRGQGADGRDRKWEIKTKNLKSLF